MKLKLFSRVSSKDVAVFTRQFAVMIKAGVAVVRCLEILAEQTQNKTFKEIILTIIRDVETGNNLSDALFRQKPTFNNLYVAMTRAGEAGGVLDKCLERVAEYLEKSESLKGKIKGAIAYPAVIFIVAIGATGFMLISIIPTFAKMFEGLDAELPGLTRAVLLLSGFLTNYFYILIAIIIGGIFALRSYIRTGHGKMRWDTTMLNLPVFGSLIRKAAVARFARTLATLIGSGVPVLSGLEITAFTSGNKVLEKAILRAKESISGGKTINQPLKDSGVFPPLLTNLIQVGEESGTIGEMLEKCADFYEDEVDTAVTTLTSLIEPITIVLLGGIIGTLLAAMYMPMFQLASAIK